MNAQDLERVLGAYIECALWSSTDEDGESLDGLYSADDLSDETRDEMTEDVSDFLESNEELIQASGLTLEQVGHDFWLTRNRHGAGFWDRGLGEVGDKLTEMAHPYGSCDLYVGDDGQVYAS